MAVIYATSQGQSGRGPSPLQYPLQALSFMMFNNLPLHPLPLHVAVQLKESGSKGSLLLSTGWSGWAWPG